MNCGDHKLRDYTGVYCPFCDMAIYSPDELNMIRQMREE